MVEVLVGLFTWLDVGISAASTFNDEVRALSSCIRILFILAIIYKCYMLCMYRVGSSCCILPHLFLYVEM